MQYKLENIKPYHSVMIMPAHSTQQTMFVFILNISKHAFTADLSKPLKSAIQ